MEHGEGGYAAERSRTKVDRLSVDGLYPAYYEFQHARPLRVSCSTAPES